MSARLPWIIAAVSVVVALLVVVYTLGERAGRHSGIVAPPPVVTPATTPGAVPTPTPLTAPPAPTAAVASPQPTAPSAAGGNRLFGVVLDPAGKPVAGATVTVLFAEGAGRGTRKATADASGKFAVEGIPAPQVDATSVEADGFERSDINAPIPLPLDDGFTITLNRLAELRLQVLVQKSGGATQPYGGDATLYLSRRRPPSETTASASAAPAREIYETMLRKSVTVEAGRVVLTGTAPGTYRASLLAGEEFAESEPFTVESGAGSGATIILGRRQAFRGTVVAAADKRPLANAEVILRMTSRPTVSGLSAPVRARTQAQGSFEITGLTPGTYALTLAATGFTTRTVEEVPVLAGPEAAPPETYALSEGAAAVEVVVTDGNGRPVPGAPLVLFSSGASQPRSFFGQTDQAGTHRFDPVPAGRYTLAANPPDSRSRQRTTDVVVGEGESKVVTVRIAKPQRFLGRARLAGKPFAGLLSFVQRGTVSSKQFTKTDDLGSFQVELEPGQYVVGRDDQPGNLLVNIAPGQTADLELELK